MTQEKKNQVHMIINNLNNSRRLLDDVMFGGEGVSDEEFFRLRSCYDVICLALDKL